MKRAFITTAVLAFSLIQSFGQITLGVKAGLNFSNAKNIASANNQTRLALYGGLLTEIPISKKFIVQPELLYSIKGFKYPATTFSGGGTLSLNYISIPFLGGFRPNDKFTLFLGPEFNFLTSASSKFGGTRQDVSKNYRKFDAAIDIGATCKIINGLAAEFRYSHGFNDLADVILTGPSGNELGKDRVGSNRVFQLGLTYKFSKK